MSLLKGFILGVFLNIPSEKRQEIFYSERKLYKKEFYKEEF